MKGKKVLATLLATVMAFGSLESIPVKAAQEGEGGTGNHTLAVGENLYNTNENSETNEKNGISTYDNGAYTGVPVGEEWYDTDGDSIQAHGGGFLQEGDTYYWVGENKSHGSANFKSVSLYSSKDLLNWKNEGEILTKDSPTIEGAEYGLID